MHRQVKDVDNCENHNFKINKRGKISKFLILKWGHFVIFEKFRGQIEKKKIF